MKEKLEKDEDEDLIEEEEEEDDLNLIKIKSGEYVVKEQNVQKNKIQNDKVSKIKEIEEFHKNKLAREYTFLDEKSNIELKNITNLHKFEVEKIEKELEKIRIRKEDLKKNEKVMKIEDFYK